MSEVTARSGTIKLFTLVKQQGDAEFSYQSLPGWDRIDDPDSASMSSASSSSCRRASSTSTSSSDSGLSQVVEPEFGAVILPLEPGDLQYNHKERQFEVKSGRPCLLQIFDKLSPRSKLRGDLEVSVAFSLEDLRAEEPIRATPASCQKIKGHPTFSQDRDDMRSHVFRAWTHQKGDGEYFTTTDGHQAVRLRIHDGTCRLNFLCVTEEIKRNKYWDLELQFCHQGSTFFRKIPIQVMRELRRTCKKQKRQNRQYQDMDCWSMLEDTKPDFAPISMTQPPSSPKRLSSAPSSSRKQKSKEDLVERLLEKKRIKYMKMPASLLRARVEYAEAF